MTDRGKTSGILGSFGLPEPTEEQRKEAIAHPGPTWREYLYYSFLKVWILLALFIIDIWIIATFLVPFDPILMAASLGVTVFLETLLYQYLWRRPNPYDDAATFRPSIVRPVLYGRWTPEADRVRQGRPALGPRRGPDPREFL